MFVLEKKDDLTSVAVPYPFLWKQSILPNDLWAAIRVFFYELKHKEALLPGRLNEIIISKWKKVIIYP